MNAQAQSEQSAILNGEAVADHFGDALSPLLPGIPRLLAFT
ncbi:hypothetical protein [Nocardia sp. NPDC052566]